MKIGLIGLGDIANKAYLPVLGLRDDVTLHISTRNPVTLKKTGDRYRVPVEHRHQAYQDLLDFGLDAVFVHTATESHYEIVKKCLEAGLHVFVDKPVDYSLEGTEKLVSLAKQNKRFLMTGFNRRFAPMYAWLYRQGTPDIVIMQKNRVDLPGAIRTFILDDFIHVVDTVRAANPAPWKELHVQWKRTEDGKLAHVLFQLAGQRSTRIGIMNRESGIAEETLEWMQTGSKYRVTNLRERLEYTGNEERRKVTGDWASIGEVRGFKAMVDSFLAVVEAVQQGEEGIWTELTRRMDEDLATHRLCEEIIKRIEVEDS